ncbi:MAG TPA: TetR family transcriptional regulator [Brachybacterium sp.]|nr:TetR family transcriptional regulator [Brachybacterium sp.]
MNASPDAPEGPRARHNRAGVVEAALGILDQQGLPDLTMRRLAQVLEVRPSALYWHFTSKQALLAAVSARILEPLQRASTDLPSLAAAASVLGSQLRECLLAHRDAAELVSSSLALGLVDPPLHGLLGMVAERVDAPDRLARTTAEAVTHFVIGHAFHEQQRRHAEALGVRDSSERPAATTASTPADGGETDFTQVLDLIAAGVAAQLRHGARSR